MVLREQKIRKKIYNIRRIVWQIAGKGDWRCIDDIDHWVFIYENEAGIQGVSLDLRFERPDYDSLEDLSEAFLSTVTNLIGK